MPAEPTAPAPAARTEPELFQSVEQWMDSAKFQEMMRDEFPEDADSWLDPISRRNFLALSAASVALASGCNPSLRPASQRQVVPYVDQPVEVIPGVPLFFATAMPQQSGVGLGLLVKSLEGRPVKCEGNPNHPSSLGSIDLQALAAPLTLHDPDRSRAVTLNGNGSTFDKALAAVKTELAGKDGTGVVFLTEPTTSPTVHRLMGDVLKTYPKAKWVRYEPVGRGNEAAALAAAFPGKPASLHYKLDAADVILSLDADFLTTGPGAVRYARDFGARRKLSLILAEKELHHEHEEAAKKDGKKPTHKHFAHETVLAKAVEMARMNRLYVVEGALTSTGSIADHRLPLKPSRVEGFTRAVAAKVGVLGAVAPADLSPAVAKWVEEVSKDLLAKKGKAVVIAGEHQSAATHLLALAINETLGAFGTTVAVTAPLDPAPPNTDLKALVADMTAGKVSTLFLIGVNPVYDAPADLNFAEAMAKVKTKVHHGLYADETAVPHCTWHIPAAHFLEGWGDVRGHDGTASIIQPLIAPMHGGKTAIDLLAAILNTGEPDGLEAVKGTWRAAFDDTAFPAAVKDKYKKSSAAAPAHDFDRYWESAVRAGVLEGSVPAAPAVAAVKLDKLADPALSVAAVQGLEIQFRPDPALFDGKQANNGWLQELPKPMTNLTWDNAAMVSPATAESLQFRQSFAWTAGERGRTETDLAELTVNGRKLKVAVHILPAMADDVVVLHLGFGRERAGRVASPEDKTTTPGFNAYKLRGTDAVWNAPAELKRLNERFFLAVAGAHWAMESRRPVRHATLEQFRDEKVFAQVPSISPGEYQDIRALTPGTVENFEMLETERLKQRNADAGTPYTHPYAPDHEHPHEGHHDKRLKPLSLYVGNPIHVNGVDANIGYRRWGMTIDLGSCTGCAACTLACVAENNIPVVGKDQVSKGRAMHWIRLDRYFSIPTATVLEDDLGAGGLDPVARGERIKKSAEIRVHVQPVPCQQCEKAPCEVVCPVGATVHSADGLNDMVYNRCVGTRYCSNNCPYKVRRFNFLQYADYTTEGMKLVNNPDVTVRTRGVMEKCTYCVQRIRAAVIEAEREWDKKKPNGEPLREADATGRPKVYDGEILTACQQACPTQAITFGDLNDPRSAVIRTKAEPHNYGLLAEVNTMPRTSYLAAVRNPNPNLPQGA
jgi:molybdopterin-containing oxidoreductase family iron-sulfur binding subunit